MMKAVDPKSSQNPPNQTQPEIDFENWHSITSEEALIRLQSTMDGLDHEEAQRRLKVFGYNRLPSNPGRGAVKRFLDQLNNVLIYVLLLSAVIAAGMNHWVDSAVILAVVIINSWIGFMQEGKAEKALEAIQNLLDPKASVFRKGQRRTVSADSLAPGDIVALEAGDRCPADIRLIRSKGISSQEAALTGESVPVNKSIDPVSENSPLGDQICMVFSGTLITQGHGLGVVVATGGKSELGKISALIQSTPSLKTPLLRKMDAFGRQITAVISVVSALAFIGAYFGRKMPFSEAFMPVIGLFVAAIPEGLPAVMTITLAIGVRRMAARNAIIRRLPAVETLGAVSIICSDKTGTLTRNEMTATRLVTSEMEIEVTGVGYDPKGDLLLNGHRIDTSEIHASNVINLARIALICNDATLERKSDVSDWAAHGDPMEAALVTLSMKAGLDPDHERKVWNRTDEIPFDSRHKFMAVLCHNHEGFNYVMVKGAPERILSMCTRVADGSELKLDYWENKVQAMASEGLRALAFARKAMESGQGNVEFDDVENGLELVGIVGLMDPPREEAAEAARLCREAGIGIKMITGDHAATATGIAKAIGIAESIHTLEGKDLDQMDESEFEKAANEAQVFARTSPEHKIRLVEALQRRGKVIAMTGDGVNDAPALKRADIGIAMGKKGSEAAKEASEMALADDNFASIVSAVREGRIVYDNLKKVIGWTLPTNGGEACTILAALIFGLSLPVTAAQILWVNMITAVTLGLTLAFDPASKNIMTRSPRLATDPLLTGRVAWQVFFVSVMIVIGVFGIFVWSRRSGNDLEISRTIVVNTLVALQVVYLLIVRADPGSGGWLHSIKNSRAVWIGIGSIAVAQIVFTYAPWMNHIFETQPLSGRAWGQIALVGLIIGLIIEAETRLHHRWSRSSSSSR